MIEVNGYRYAETENEFIDSLFTDKTCSGYATRKKRSILFTDAHKKPIAFMNTHNVTGTASPLEDGKIWYSYAIPYFNEKRESKPDEYAIGRDHIGYYFK